MKYLSAPIKLLEFWYPESLVIFLRIWKNSLLYLEEDLAVSLMAKLLFVPLFHDSSLLGCVLSFLFRSFRILLGLTAFLLVTVLIMVLGVGWFLLPVLVVFLSGIPGITAKILFFSGVVLFINHIISHPRRKLWQIYSVAGKAKNWHDIRQCSFVKRENFPKLLKTDAVGNILLYLEQTRQNFSTMASTASDEEILEQVWDLGRKLKLPYLGPEHFFTAMLCCMPNIENDLLKRGLALTDFFEALDFLQKKSERWRRVMLWDEGFKVRHLKGVNRGWLGTPTPSLDMVSEDLTRGALQEAIPDFIGGQQALSQIINILSLEKGRNVLIVGEPGSGKSALVSYLAKLIVKGDAPATLATNRLVRLDLTKLLAGIGNQGELAERIKNIFEEIKFSGNIILFVDEIQNLGIGEAGSKLNIYSLLLPYIESSDFQFIATTENNNYVSILEKNASFARLFTKVELPPATISETMNILKNRAIDTERYKKIKTSILAIHEIAKLSAEYIHDRVLPDSALHIFQQCQVAAQNGWIKKSTVDRIIQLAVKVPVEEMNTEAKKEVLNLEEIIHQRFIDQEEAVKDVANILRRAAAKLTDTERPIGSFLFVGPTGVGKTELAKILSEEYFTKSTHNASDSVAGGGTFVRFDMSEYQTTEGVNRLIGKTNEAGQLTEIVKQNPYTLILLDEFEKADPKILTLFLQVLEDGRLTDGMGKLVDFTNTIIIAASNAASLIIAKSLKQGRALKEIDGVVRAELLQIFKPELLNRFDAVVLFKPLSLLDLQKIVLLKLASLQNKLKEQGFLVEFDQGLVKKLAEKGYDPVFGARPLRRLIQDTLESKLSVMILEGKLVKGQPFKAGLDLLA